MRKIKILFASLTALSCFCVSCLPITKQISSMYSVIANAEDTEEIVTSGTCGENLTWNFEKSTGTLTISGNGAMTNYTGTFPWRDLRLNIKKVILENGVTTIGKYAFSFCYALESVIIPDSVTTIEECAFCDCSALESIVISDSVTTIEFDAFENTPWLENKKNKNPFVIVNGILIDGKACEDDIVIPNSVTSIAEYAFMFCDSLTSVTIPNSVTTIGNGAFYGCDGLESVTIPDSVTSIGDKVFKSCKSLISIYVDENNLHYSSQDNILFDKNKSELITFPIKNNIIEYIIPDSVTSITEYAFYMCDALESVTIPDSVTTIGESAFEHCESLTSIYVDENNLHYSSQDNILFDKNKSELITFPIKNTIIEYIIPDSVTTIGDDAFEGCDALESVTIPDSVTKIGEYAFHDCTSLTSITIENPECEIYDFEYTISTIATIYGYDNSTAKAYAEEYNRNFISIGTKRKNPIKNISNEITWQLLSRQSLGLNYVIIIIMSGLIAAIPGIIIIFGLGLATLFKKFLNLIFNK